MDSKATTMTVGEILNLYKRNMLRVDPEYQRGEVWTEAQQQYFIDSVLRGYHIPLIYLHYIPGERIHNLTTGDQFYIIDGQQRIRALYLFSEGALRLLDPKKHQGRFPASLQEAPCPWASRTILTLDEGTYDKFFETTLSVAKIETDKDDEVRDLFIRLQGGKSLTSQEQRDAWPGEFGSFVFSLAGKKDIARYPGDVFFDKLVSMKIRTPRIRQLAAQMFMVFRRHYDSGGFCDINRKAVDTFYLNHVTFDSRSNLAQGFVSALTTLMELLGDGKRPKIVGHQAIHLVLLTHALSDDSYVSSSWRDGFAAAFDEFTDRVNKAKKTKDDTDAYWSRYGRWTTMRTDAESTIRLRHEFFSKRMLEFVQPRLKDPRRLFGTLEKQIIYMRDQKMCQVCMEEVLWNEAEFHHVVLHSTGGHTDIENGVLVHSACHPKHDQAVRNLTEKIKIDRSVQSMEIT